MDPTKLDPSAATNVEPHTRASRSPALPRRRARGVAVTVAVALLAVACAACGHRVRYEPAAEVRFVPPARVMVVQNAGARPIAAIRVKPCGAPDSDFQALAQSSVAPGARYSIPVDQHPDCVDLEATTARGEAVGRQTNLHMVPGGGWTIQ